VGRGGGAEPRGMLNGEAVSSFLQYKMFWRAVIAFRSARSEKCQSAWID